MSTVYHVLSLGAGVQSTRLALEFDAGEILDAQGSPVQLDAAYFADTQDEPAAVYRHLDWLLRTVRNYPIRVRTKGRLSEHLRAGMNSTSQRFATIPAFTAGLGLLGLRVGQLRRQCSSEYKIRVIEQAIRREVLNLPAGRAVPPGRQVIQYLGISLDECGRALRVMRNRIPQKWKEAAQTWDYPRLQIFLNSRRWTFGFPLVDRFITRPGCLEYLRPRVPHQTPRSACVYCPFHDDAEWTTIQQEPADWELAVTVDRALRPGAVVNRRLNQPIYLHRSCQPLELVQFDTTPNPRQAQLSMNFAAECLGVCGV